MTNKSLENKYGSKQKDGGAHIDRARTSTAQDVDWAPSVGPAFRKRGPDGNFLIDADGQQTMQGQKPRVRGS